MECSCTVDAPVDECEFGLDMVKYHLVALEPLKCCECERQIEEMETYLHEKGIPEGEEDEKPEDEWDWHEYNTCLDCKSIRDQFFNGFIYTMILHDLEVFLDESDGSTNEECIAALTPRARERVCGMIENVWRKIEAEEQGGEE